MIYPDFQSIRFPSTLYSVGHEKIREFARAINNSNPIHHNEEYAKKAGHPSIVAPPTFIAVVQAKPLENIFTILSLPLNRIIHGGQEFHFYRLIRKDDIISTSSRITDVKKRERFDIMTVELLSNDQEGENICKALYTLIINK